MKRSPLATSQRNACQTSLPARRLPRPARRRCERL